MKIRINTIVDGHYLSVMEKFDESLFRTLLPRFPKSEIVKFTGSNKGDVVHIRFLQPLRTDWISKITDLQIDEEKAYFVDTGVKLPFGIKFWKHKHIVKKLSPLQSIIIDDIQYKTGNKLFSVLLYPMLYFGFFARKKLYKAYFTKNNNYG